jgi:hypothetical protein
LSDVAQCVSHPSTDSGPHRQDLVDRVKLGAESSATVGDGAVDSPSSQERSEYEPTDSVDGEPNAALGLPPDRAQGCRGGTGRDEGAVPEGAETFGSIHAGKEAGLAKSESESVFVVRAEDLSLESGQPLHNGCEDIAHARP